MRGAIGPPAATGGRNVEPRWAWPDPPSGRPPRQGGLTVTVPGFRAHVVNGRIAADGEAGRPAGAAVIVAELYSALEEDAPAEGERATVVGAAA
jgi:hypothetical protein